MVSSSRPGAPLLFLLIFLLLSVLGIAGEERVVARAGPAARLAEIASSCTEPGHREFDFWIGSWIIDQTIHDPPGGAETFFATSDVRSTLDGCAIFEEWHGRVRFPWEGMTEPDSLHGLSVRSYDPRAGEWRIHWMDSRQPTFGAPFIGSFVDGVGTFVRSIDQPDGGRLTTRIVFDAIEPKSVRWRLSVSGDDGATWTLLWEMLMRRRSLDAQGAWQ